MEKNARQPAWTDTRLKDNECLINLLEASGDAVVVADQEGKIRFWNSSAERLFGYRREEALHMALEELMPEEYRARHRDGFERFVKTGIATLMGSPVTVKGRRKDGSAFPVELTLSADNPGGGLVVAAIIRDITGRRAFEHKLAHQSRLLARANKELAILAKVAGLLSQSIETRSLLDAILDAITKMEIFRLEKKGGIMILRDGVLELAAHLPGHGEDFLERHRAVKVGECLCGLAVETGEVLTSADSSTDSRHTITYADMRPHSHIIVPLKAKGSVVGVMYLYMQPEGRVDRDRMHFLESIGGMLGAAISNSMLFEETRRLALHDHLTGLPNKRLLVIELERNFALAKRYARPLSCLMVDLDHFKRYNDAHGHIAGDNLLQSVAGAIGSSLRETDFAARYGGEEFCVLLPETSIESAVMVGDKIRKAVKAACAVTASVGVAGVVPGMAGPGELVDAADRALYRAKEAGRDAVVASRDGT